MKNYKDAIIEKFDNLFKQLNSRHVLTSEEYAKYYSLMQDYAAEQATEEILDKCLPDGYAYYSNCYILRSREDGEIIVKSYDKEKSEVMMRDVSKQICFSDCDDTYEVIKIVYHGREVEYAGWRPCMEYKYYFVDTKDIAWKEFFPQWDH